MTYLQIYTLLCFLISFLILSFYLDSRLCPCNCEYRDKLIYWGSQIITNKTYEELMEELKPKIQKLKEELYINKTSLSSNIRRKKSAPDNRKSSKNIGYLGVFLVAVVISLVVIIDIVSLKKYILQCS